MNLIKRLLFSLLGVKNYLLVVSRTFLLLYRLRLIKGNKLFDCHYFVKKLIKNGDTVIDIGANLGYYSVIFSKLVGNSGKVYSVEPVQLYRRILENNTRSCKNVEIIPYALGETDEQKIKMGAPSEANYFSHGRTHVLDKNDECSMVFDATVMRPDTLFAHLNSLQYIKCDIEGYEGIAIPLFEKIFDRFQPIVQIEIAGENMASLTNFFKSKAYRVFTLKGERLKEVLSESQKTFGDFFFVPANKIEMFSTYIV